MATYNGARYLREQLDSFSSQTRLPDELVICDDSSTDNTLEIVREFAKKTAFIVRIYSNESRLRYAANFGRAIERCTGDLIILSDQDDVWFPNKIERIEQVFIAAPSTWVIVNDAEITDDELKDTGLTVAGQMFTAGLKIDGLHFGCCMSFRAQLKPVLLPVPNNTHGHDSWINKLGQILGVRAFLPDVLQYYRRHATNSSESVTNSTRRATRWGVEKAKISRESRRIDPVIATNRRLVQRRVLKDRLESHANYLSTLLASDAVLLEAVIQLDVQIKANEARETIQKQRLWKRVFLAMHFYQSGGYRQFEGWKSLAKDVLR
mgnify:CR=1 FL=1